MGKFNRQEQLKQLHAERKVKTEQKVSKAINELVRKNEEINFNIVAKHSNVSKATLYNNSKIRKRIEELREQSKDIFVHKNNSDGKDALISSLKRRVHISIKKSMFSICRIVKCKITIDCINFQNFSCIV